MAIFLHFVAYLRNIGKTYFASQLRLKNLSFFNPIYLALYLSDYLRIRLCQIPLNKGSTSIKTLEKLEKLDHLEHS